MNKLFRKFQLKIKDRQSAGTILAGLLRDSLRKDSISDIVIFGLPRGGLIVAEIIAKKLSCNLDMILVKRLRAPYNEELAIGAVTEDGTIYLNKTLIEELKVSDQYIDNELSYQLVEIKHQADTYYVGRKNFLDKKNIIVTGKTIVIVDDGAATGSTLMATVKSLRNKHDTKRIIVAVPVIPKSTVNLLRREGIDHIEVIISPSDNNFGSIEQFYHNFDQVSNSQVLDIVYSSMNKNHLSS
ncbi:MAG TPA: phosphoribosyltransferase family protein [Nitrososphaeraceae archaeon]|nr:phosphoribosyltransferase family protein [Nitrososphaeraceae archaeon]